MKQMTVADFKADFSGVLSQVSQGESIQILYGRNRRPVAVLSKTEQIPSRKRKLGILEGIATFSEKDDGKITEEEFLGL